MKPSVAVIVLTLNETDRIESCLRQFYNNHFDYIYVLDGESKDNTVNLAKQYATKIDVKAFSGSFAKEKKYAWKQLPLSYKWVLWSDCDEIWLPDFLINIEKILQQAEDEGVSCFRFPRVQLPNPLESWPDYQIRLIKNTGEFEWRGKTHECLWSKKYNLPLDKMDNANLQGEQIGIGNLDNYHVIIHLPRSKKVKREWW